MPAARWLWDHGVRPAPSPQDGAAILAQNSGFFLVWGRRACALPVALLRLIQRGSSDWSRLWCFKCLQVVPGSGPRAE